LKKPILPPLFIALILAFTVSPGLAEIDGNMLLDNCKEAVSYLENENDPSINLSAVNFCVGFVSGVNEVHNTFVSSVSCFDPPVFCIPPQTKPEQLVKVVFKFLKSHPEDLHYQGSVITISALKEAFPCH